MVPLILGIVGLVMAADSKKMGFVGGVRTAGLVLSIIGVVLSGIDFMACGVCAVCVGTAVSELALMF